MPGCSSNLSGNFIKECTHRPKQGVTKKWYINWEDIDRVATQLNASKTGITALVLKSGAKIYKAEGTDKTSKASHALVVGEYANSYTHTDTYTLLYKGDAQKEQIQKLVDGARVVSLIEKVDTGLAGETTFEIVGFESGMLITNDDYDTGANSGTTTIVVATKEGEEEATGIKSFLDSDVATTRTWISTNEAT